MKRIIASLIVSSLVLIVAPRVPADPMQHMQGSTQPTALDRMKQLEGEWTGEGTHGTEKMPVTVTYHVTAAGSAVMETLFPGTPHEMVTMYTLDGGKLVLTHYCAMGNQPRMKLRAGGSPDELVFEFAGGPGIDPGKDAHMHDALLRFTDAGHLHAEWTSWMKGKPGEKATFDLTRKQ